MGIALKAIAAARVSRISLGRKAALQPAVRRWMVIR